MNPFVLKVQRKQSHMQNCSTVHVAPIVPLSINEIAMHTQINKWMTGFEFWNGWTAHAYVLWF